MLKENQKSVISYNINRMKDVIKQITQKDDKAAYVVTKQIIAESKLSSDYYSYFDDFAALLNDEKSYIRTRAFMLCCAQAKWDDGKIKSALPLMVKQFNDIKPTVVRQALDAIKEVVICCPELCMNILESLKNIELEKYKDSMVPLIKKDIENLTELINEQLRR